MRLLEFLDEDQSLTPREMGTALQMYMEMEWSGNNPSERDLTYWLTNTISSAAQDDDFTDDTLDEDHFVTLVTKLGMSETGARAIFADYDDGDGLLTIGE